MGARKGSDRLDARALLADDPRPSSGAHDQTAGRHHADLGALLGLLPFLIIRHGGEKISDINRDICVYIYTYCICYIVYMYYVCMSV